MTPKYAVIVIDPSKIQELVDVHIGDNIHDVIVNLNAVNVNIGVPVFVNVDTSEPEAEKWFVSGYFIPRKACKSILYV